MTSPIRARRGKPNRCDKPPFFSGFNVSYIVSANRDAPGTRVHVSNLEAIDGTPILDVKPVLDVLLER